MTVHDISAKIQMIVLKVSLATVAFFTIGAAANAADDIVFFQNDVMGSAIVAVNKYGDLCWSESYTPYGDKTLEEDVGIGMPAGCGLLGQERGYTGHTDDYESGLTYAQQRYYDPSIGRFLSVDPIGINVLNTRTINRYSYAANNPYRYTDPTGEAYGDPEAEDDDWPSDLNWSDGDYDWAGYSSLRGGSAAVQHNFDLKTAELDQWVSDYDGMHPAELLGGGFSLSLKRAVSVVKGWFGFGKSVANGAGNLDNAVEAGLVPNRIYSARELKRRADEPGPYHNFPESLNDQIFKGDRTVISDNYIQYSQRGTLNGRAGTYEIGVRPSESGRTEVITHRFFRPDPN